jgi:predicted alpha/beta hydrolase family esterase
MSRRTEDHGAQQQKEIAKDVIVVGHSLGTGVAGKLIGELADKGGGFDRAGR